ncbi:hypothetical protein [Thiococcus pfennigii]|uniref:hypothetical protein n=1 Tax=Thiococcus pfennigii TaxID=1057 RepID=UPI001905083D|nr:hypothetical protein [Thiococcus pfennigii]MBK1730377.1 hypothetical protein [Thiococcus pfennigii]
MAEAALERRVDTLEEYMKELSYQSLRTEMELARLSKEMREFKDEMRAFKDEMGEFKDEMRTFKDESVQERRHMNKQWGDLANRLGTLVEDIVAPNLPRIAETLFGCTNPDLFAIRIRRRFDGASREYDALLACGGVLLVNETKSRLLDSHVPATLEKLAEIPNVFPEYAERRCIGLLATLYPDPSVVRLATRHGLLVMGMGDETMQILNPEALTHSA